MTDADIDRRAAKHLAELKRMVESARRSLGQRIRHARKVVREAQR